MIRVGARAAEAVNQADRVRRTARAMTVNVRIATSRRRETRSAWEQEPSHRMTTDPKREWLKCASPAIEQHCRSTHRTGVDRFGLWREQYDTLKVIELSSVGGDLEGAATWLDMAVPAFALWLMLFHGPWRAMGSIVRVSDDGRR
jgi:hypothetical protein